MSDGLVTRHAMFVIFFLYFTSFMNRKRISKILFLKVSVSLSTRTLDGGGKQKFVSFFSLWNFIQDNCVGWNIMWKIVWERMEVFVYILLRLTHDKVRRHSNKLWKKPKIIFFEEWARVKRNPEFGMQIFMVFSFYNKLRLLQHIIIIIIKLQNFVFLLSFTLSHVFFFFIFVLFRWTHF